MCTYRAMAEKEERENQRRALVGVEEKVVDLVFEALTSQQRAKLLRAPLELAAARGNQDLVQNLVKAGAEMGGALHAAAEGDHLDVVHDLVMHRASVNASDSAGFTPLRVAARKGNTAVVRMLLLHPGTYDRDAADYTRGWTPLVTAVNSGHLAITRALVTAGADVSVSHGDSNKSLVHLAVELKRVAILRVLVKHGADVDGCATGQITPLHIAAGSNDVESIHVLAQAGADLEARANDGLTPLHKAITGLNLEAVITLLKHGADVNSADEDAAETSLLYVATYAGTKGVAGIVDILLRSGADEAIVDTQGYTALDVVGSRVDEQQYLVEDFNRVCELLTSAPADRAWRRRGYLILCRARFGTRALEQEFSRTPAGVSSRTRSRATMENAETGGCGTGAAAGGACMVDPGTGRDWVGVRTRSRAKMASAKKGGCSTKAVAVGACVVDVRASKGWARVAFRVVDLAEEGIFRMVVGFL